jgi:uncharacterized peroxidase-related enzyme
MSAYQHDHIMALDLKQGDLDERTLAYFDKCQEKLGMIPNVLLAYAWHPEKLAAFSGMYNNLMLGDSGLSKLEREMIAVAVSSENKCVYCLVSHGQAVRQYSGDPVLGELLVMNYRNANLEPRQRTMLDFAVKMTENPKNMSEEDRQSLRDVGFSDADIFDVAEVAAFFNMTNRVALAIDMMPNLQYHGQNR